MSRAQRFYRMLLDNIDHDQVLDEVVIGQTWTYSRCDDAIGLAMTPAERSRTLPWSGSLRGRSVRELAQWIHSWCPFQSSVAMSAINSAVNERSDVLAGARLLHGQWPGNLAVFEYFYPVLRNKRVVVIGRYPQMDNYLSDLDLTVLEMNPGPGDLPPQAAEYLLPEADWVFLSATTIANKTFPRLSELAANANVVLMGPSAPWLEDLADYGVDYIAGIVPTDAALLRQTVSEGGGTRLLEAGACYAVADLANAELGWLDIAIDDLVSRRGQMIRQMAASPLSRAEHELFLRLLAQIDEDILQLEKRHRQLWHHQTPRLAGSA